MRGKETIDSELRLLAAVRWSIREHGGEPSSRHVDELLDERNELTGICQVRDIETIDSELRLVAALRRAARVLSEKSCGDIHPYRA